MLSGECVLRRRGRGAAAAPVGLLPLPARDRAHHGRRGRGAVRDLHDRRAHAGQAIDYIVDPLAAKHGASVTEPHELLQRGLRGPRPHRHARAGALAAAASGAPRGSASRSARPRSAASACAELTSLPPLALRTERISVFGGRRRPRCASASACSAPRGASVISTHSTRKPFRASASPVPAGSVRSTAAATCGSCSSTGGGPPNTAASAGVAASASTASASAGQRRRRRRPALGERLEAAAELVERRDAGRIGRHASASGS